MFYQKKFYSVLTSLVLLLGSNLSYAKIIDQMDLFLSLAAPSTTIHLDGFGGSLTDAILSRSAEVMIGTRFGYNGGCISVLHTKTVEEALTLYLSVPNIESLKHSNFLLEKKDVNWVEVSKNLPMTRLDPKTLQKIEKWIKGDKNYARHIYVGLNSNGETELILRTTKNHHYEPNQVFTGTCVADVLTKAFNSKDYKPEMF